MASIKNDGEFIEATSSAVGLEEFQISGLFGRNDDVTIRFPHSSESGSPTVLILSGRNGTGKTTMLRMIAGILDLNFDLFRSIPFGLARLKLTTEDEFSITNSGEKRLPIVVATGKLTIRLAANRSAPNYKPDEQQRVDEFRAFYLPILNAVKFEFVDLDRSPRFKREMEDETPYRQGSLVVTASKPRSKTLASRVSDFLRESQIDYSRYFRAEELAFLPKVLSRLQADSVPLTVEELQTKVTLVSQRLATMDRYGLYVDKDQIRSLALILSDNKGLTQQQLMLLSTYVEMQEGAQQARELIAKRLAEFELIMDDFLFGKQIRIHAQRGIQIVTKDAILTEEQLSSGEYHFLYMMITALLCQRSGTIIAIDEPELSLHVSWQRKLISALSRCASGASPLFLLATHSIVLSAEYSDNTKRLSPLD